MITEASLGSGKHLPVFAGIVEADLAPLLARDVEVVARAGQIHQVAVDVLRHAVLLLAFEIAAREFIRKCQPAGGMNVCCLEDGVNLVFGLQALGNDLELQGADGAARKSSGEK